MIKVHKTGYPTLAIAFIIFSVISVLAYFYFGKLIFSIITLGLLGIYIFLISFFRNPERTIPKVSSELVYAPADGKVVVIEDVEDADYFGDKRIQVSIFMSPLNVHVNRASITGKVTHSEHRKGKYMPAWNPKSSTDNEQWVTVIQQTEEISILLKQIAGALARRIVNFTTVGDSLTQGQEYGFIKFGSRVDILLPQNATILVEKEQVVKGNIDVIAKL